MDDVTKNVAVAVPHQDAGRAEVWYDTLKQTMTDGLDWEEYKTKLRQDGASQFDQGTIEEFIQATEAWSSDPLATIVDLTNATTDELVLLYQETMEGGEGQEGEGEEGPREEFDQGAYDAFMAGLQQMWDGAEDTWQQFLDWARYGAYEAGDQIGEAFDRIIEYVNNSSDKVSALAECGIQVAAKGSN